MSGPAQSRRRRRSLVSATLSLRQAGLPGGGPGAGPRRQRRHHPGKVRKRTRTRVRYSLHGEVLEGRIQGLRGLQGRQGRSSVGGKCQHLPTPGGEAWQHARNRLENKVEIVKKWPPRGKMFPRIIPYSLSQASNICIRVELKGCRYLGTSHWPIWPYHCTTFHQVISSTTFWWKTPADLTSPIWQTPTMLQATPPSLLW